MNQPLVSIVIPSYNGKSYIEDALRSSFSQTYKNIEIIVVDDGSTDDTSTFLAPYREDQKIVYIFQENKGLSGARNTGIQAARGEYIALLDADDIFLPEKVQESVTFLENNPEVDISYHDVYHFWDGRREERFKLNYKYYSGEDVLKQIIQGIYFIAPSTTVFRRRTFEKFGMFDETLRRSEDLEFFLRVSSKGGKIYFIPNILGELRLKENSGLQSFSSQAAMKIASLGAFEKAYDEMSEASRKKYHFSFYLVYHRLRAAMACLAIGEKNRARPYVLRSFDKYRFGWVASRLLWAFFFVIPVFIWETIIPFYRNTRLRYVLKPIKR